MNNIEEGGVSLGLTVHRFRMLVATPVAYLPMVS
jgi:hypothetical protein